MAANYDPDGLVTVTVQLYNRQLGLLAAKRGRSRYIRSAFGLLENGSLDPWMRAGETEGDALRRAIADAGKFRILERQIADVLMYAETAPARTPPEVIIENMRIRLARGFLLVDGPANRSALKYLGEPAAPGGGEE